MFIDDQIIANIIYRTKIQSELKVKLYIRVYDYRNIQMSICVQDKSIKDPYRHLLGISVA